MQNVEEFFYKLSDIYKNQFFSNREKLFLFFKIYKEFFSTFIANDKASFTEYAMFYYILQKIKFPPELHHQIIAIRRYVLHLKRKTNFEPTAQIVENFLQILLDSIVFATQIKLPKELNYLQNNLIKNNNNFFNNFASADVDNSNQINKLDEIVLTYTNKIISNDNVNLICRDDNDNKFVISINHNKLEMLRPAWLCCLLCFTNLSPIPPIVSNKKQEEDLYSGAQFFQTTDNTQIVIEPNFLVDVTDITDCFSQKYQSPIIPIISKFLNRNAGISAFIGNIVNSFFDELIENIEVNFDAAFRNALQNKPLHLLAIIKQTPKYQNDIALFFETHRAELYNYFDNLRNTILQNNWINTTKKSSSTDYNTSVFFVEPSFISSRFGMQGRLDLMTERSNENTTSIDIIELKSNKAPTRNILTYIGVNDKRKFSLPLWLSHYIQIVCYNMLLQNRYSNSNFVSGFSAIFYSKPNEINPIRTVIDNVFVQNEIIVMRNWIVRYMRELAIGNLSILTEIKDEQINRFPVYLIEDTKKMLVTLNNLSELEKSYFTCHVALISKEIFAQKTGNFANATNSKDGNYGFSALWKLNLEEKLSQNLVIPDLSIDYEKSNFSNMHLKFHINKSNENIDFFFTTFRKGDICILYPASHNDANSNNIKPIDNQLFRGKIIEINNNYLIISLRNKLNKEKFTKQNSWCLEADYMEVVNRYLLFSISDFIFNDFANKPYILGIKSPEFVENKEVTNAVNEIENLNNEQKNIIIQALAAQNYYLIQGPPGTGKTSFILRYLAQILFTNTNENVLFLAYTNRAVDEICSSLKKINNINQSFDFIRLGNKDSSQYTDKLLSHFDIEALPENINKCRFFVATTATANASPEIFHIKSFDTIIIDEAAQVLESNIVGMLSKSKRFIMIGDEKQLPPISIIADNYINVDDKLLHSIEVNSLTDSLFERLLRICIKNSYPAFALLNTQARMAPQIMQIANNLFYNNQLKINDAIVNSKPLNVITPYDDCCYIDTPTDKHPKINHFQIEIILKLIQQIKQTYLLDFNEDITSSTIGIISPWRMQCNTILNSLSKEDRELITVDTVERFQGSEREVIIFSVPTNSAYFLSLLSNAKYIDNILVDRKLNVAITRAKRKFILIGNYEILSQNPIYNKLISQLKWIEHSAFFNNTL